MSDEYDKQVSAVIILAAGEGKRMHSQKSKLLHEIAGHSMLSYAINAAEELNPKSLVVVVGNRREQVINHLSEVAPFCLTAVQEEQRGTGHAVQCGMSQVTDRFGEIVVTYGDVPMLSGDTLGKLVKSHRENHNAITVLTAEVPDPTGYGRVIRNGETIDRIVEHRDANSAELAVNEINSGIYVFEPDVLQAGLAELKTDNVQGELYLTDVISYANQNAHRVGVWVSDDLWQTKGVNDRAQLAAMNAEVNRRILHKWMLAGVTIVDPVTTWIDADVDLGQDVRIEPGVQLKGATSIASGALIGPDTTLTNVEVGQGAQVVRSQCSLSVIGPNATVGPFAHLRPGTELAAGGKIGGFVETKNVKIGEGSKVPHLSYCGDATLDAGVNIGAGTIFANYDGTNKSNTHIGAHAFIGSNSVLVAPVDIEAGGFVAAGSTVTEDVPPGALGVARSRQHNSLGWVSKKRPSSKAAKAAAEADGQVHPEVKQSRSKLEAMKPEEYK